MKKYYTWTLSYWASFYALFTSFHVLTIFEHHKIVMFMRIRYGNLREHVINKKLESHIKRFIKLIRALNNMFIIIRFIHPIKKLNHSEHRSNILTPKSLFIQLKEKRKHKQWEFKFVYFGWHRCYFAGKLSSNIRLQLWANICVCNDFLQAFQATISTE